MRCNNPSCGRENGPDKKFCTFCGAALFGRRCAQDHAIPDGLTECPYCPRAVATSRPPAAPGRAASPTGDPRVGGSPTEVVHGTAPRDGTRIVGPDELKRSGVLPGAHGGVGSPAMPAAPAPSPARPRDQGTTFLPAGALPSAPSGPSAVPSGAAPVQTANGAYLVGFLVLLSGGRGVASWPVRIGRTTVGRSRDASVTLDLPSVSSQHAIITVREDGTAFRIWVSDENSMNGTRVNGKEIFEEKRPLTHGDVISVGDASLLLVLIPAPNAVTG